MLPLAELFLFSIQLKFELCVEFLSITSSENYPQKKINSFLESLNHRGPDNQSSVAIDNLILGHSEIKYN